MTDSDFVLLNTYGINDIKLDGFSPEMYYEIIEARKSLKHTKLLDDKDVFKKEKTDE